MNMDKKRKEYIDSLWMNTEYGQWVLFASSGEKGKADKLAEKIISSPPFSLYELDKEISAKIAEKVKNENEFEEYLKALDKENYDLVDFMISNSTFATVYDLLEQ